MAYLEDLEFRHASPSDAGAIAALHADSWRRHYRGAYSDAFLDSDVASDRLVVWTGRLRARDPLHYTMVVEDGGGLVGFAHTAFDEDSTWGSLLDNLHVGHGHTRRGIGSQLLASTVSAVLERRTGLYLWVQEQNVAAQAFYDAHG
ncbi:MAG: GNAT family N-acetyltransferase, partial [Geodermatophilaceae bacterium]|nr:GNAT family N-acetyltransferase [Geodermatophilaceae bacterium]